jgi:hypothetical protein
MKCMQTVLLCLLCVILAAPVPKVQAQVPAPVMPSPEQPAPVPPLPPEQQPPATPPATDPAAQPPADQPEASDPDIPVNPVQPDFTLVALPTTLRVPKGKGAFRVTHRFSRPLGQGDFGDLLSDFFGFDSSGLIGLEFRYGLRSGTQVGLHRTSDKAIQIFGQQTLLNERDGRPFGLDFLLTVEGEDNLSEQHQSAVGLVLSKAVGRAGSVYLQPIFVANSNPFETGDDNTFMLGLGTRLRMTKSMYFVIEAAPRLSGYDPGTTQASFALEGRTGGHSFQINVSNGLGTTYGQIARGGIGSDDWFIGFNISRKFFR